MNLQPGDLLLFRVSVSSNWLDRLIGWGQKVIHQAPTKVAYCHVAIVGPDAESIYEAVWPKVHNITFDLTKIQKNLIVEAYRVRDVTPEQVAKVMAYCQSQIGQWYSVTSIVTFGIIDIGHRPYCSLLAWRAWLAADIILGPDESMVSPDDIAASTKLVRVS